MVAANQIIQRISLPQAAKLLGKSVDFIRALHAAGEIAMFDERKPGAKIPRWMIGVEELARIKKPKPIALSLPKRKPNNAHFVYTYFFKPDGDKHIKIGIAKNVPKRLCALQIGLADPLRCVGWMLGNKEAKLHKLFARLRVRGEWFREDDALRQFIETYANDPYGKKGHCKQFWQR